MRHIELGRAVQAGYEKPVAIVGGNGEFVRVKTIKLLAGAIDDDNRGVSTKVAVVNDESGTRLWTRYGKALVGKTAPDDIACVRQREKSRHRQNRRFFLLLTKPFCGTSLSITAYCSSVSGPLSAS